MTAVLAPVTQGRSGPAFRLADAAMLGLWLVALAVAVVRAPDAFAAATLAVELSCLVGIAWWDSRTLRAPNIVVLPAIAMALLLAVPLGGAAIFEAAVGCGVAFGAVALIGAFGRGAMGAGDVKYAALAGAVVGLRGVLPLLGVAFIGGGLIAAVVLAFRLRDRKAVMAFTPLLAAGCIATVALFPVYFVR